jgi:hypothetical protein
MPSAPYGSWRSPITADLIVAASVGLTRPCYAGGDVYWQETRPAEGGRYVIVRRRSDGTVEDVNPPPFNARTRVHEYGGGSYVVDGDGTVYFANFADQRLYAVRPGAEPAPVTHTDGMRYADLVIDAARNRLICVREDHTTPGAEAVNTIAAVDLTTGDETVLVQGNDFYAYPRLSPDGASLCWIAWDHPNMPWDGTVLHVASVGAGGRLSDDRIVAGGRDVSIFQPSWSPDGRLYYVSDATGWWNLYRWDDLNPLSPGGRRVRVRGPGSTGEQPSAQTGSAKFRRGAPLPNAHAPLDPEFGQPLWQFGAAIAFDGPASSLLACRS